MPPHAVCVYVLSSLFCWALPPRSFDFADIDFIVVYLRWLLLAQPDVWPLLSDLNISSTFFFLSAKWEETSTKANPAHTTHLFPLTLFYISARAIEPRGNLKRSPLRARSLPTGYWYRGPSSRIVAILSIFSSRLRLSRTRSPPLHFEFELLVAFIKNEPAVDLP